MRFELQAGTHTCTLTEKTCSSSNKFTIPIPREALIGGLAHVLARPETRDHKVGEVFIDRMRDGLRINVGAGSYIIPYSYLYPIVMAD